MVDEGDEEDDDEDGDYHGEIWHSQLGIAYQTLTRENIDAEEGNIEFVVEVPDEDEARDNASESPEAERAAVQERLISLITSPFPRSQLVFGSSVNIITYIARRPGLLSQRQVLQYLRRSNLGHLLFDDVDEDDEEFAWGMRHRRRHYDPNRFPKVPSEKGIELMNSGTFGASEIQSTIRSKKRLARRILDRELGLGDRANRRVNQGMMAQVRNPGPYRSICYASPLLQFTLQLTLHNLI